MIMLHEKYYYNISRPYISLKNLVRSLAMQNNLTMNFLLDDA